MLERVRKEAGGAGSGRGGLGKGLKVRFGTWIWTFQSEKIGEKQETS